MNKSALASMSFWTILIGCGHTLSHHVGLVSFGDLEGKVIPGGVDGELLDGEDCCKVGSDPYSLAEAVRNAMKNTDYDTLVDVEVTNTTGLFVASNCIKVSGKALKSESLSDSGGAQ